jgi:site-specific recombinase XerD
MLLLLQKATSIWQVPPLTAEKRCKISIAFTVDKGFLLPIIPRLKVCLFEKGKIMTRKPPKTLSNAECDQLLKQLQKHQPTDASRRRAMRDSLMALLMLDAGLRVGEVVQLQVSDLIFDNVPVREIRVRPEIAKRQLERFVKVTLRLSVAIAQMRNFVWQQDGRAPDSNAFYSMMRAERLSYQHVERIIKHAARRSIMRDITPHTLRHTFATRLMRVTNIRVVQAALGHKRLSSTEIYTHPDQEDIDKAFDAMEEGS